MINLKKIIIILLLSCFSLLFSSCAQKETKTLLKFSTWGSKSEMTILLPLIEEFERKNPQIKIELIHIPKNYFQKLHLMVASNLAPDVIFLNNINGKVYIQSDILEDLTKFIKHDREITKETFFENALTAFSYEDSVYAIPRDVSNIVIYYNKTLFKKFNVPYPGESWDYNDFLKTAKMLSKDTNNDGKTDIFGVSFEENPLFWLPFLWSNGGGLLSKDLDKIILDTPASFEGLDFYSDLRNKWHVAPMAEEQGSATMAQLFMQEKIAMQISGRWNVPAYRKNIDFDWDVINFPKGKFGSIVDADASGWAISKASNHKLQAWKFIKFLSSSSSIEKFAKSGLIIPARVDIANSNTFLAKDKKPKSSEVFIKIIPTSMPTPANKNYQEIIDITEESLQPVFRGKKQTDQVITPSLIKQLSELVKKK